MPVTVVLKPSDSARSPTRELCRPFPIIRNPSPQKSAQVAPISEPRPEVPWPLASREIASAPVGEIARRVARRDLGTGFPVQQWSAPDGQTLEAEVCRTFPVAVQHGHDKSPITSARSGLILPRFGRSGQHRCHSPPDGLALQGSRRDRHQRRAHPRSGRQRA